jgi:hypothetical protein
MSALDKLDILDLTGPISAIPLMRGHQWLPVRANEQFVTLHYSAVVYLDRSRTAELARILDEAAYQIRKNWAKPGQPPIYGDGLMYDFVILSDGTIVRTRKEPRQLWHCNNAIGNRSSWSLHWMLGPGQNLTAEQRGSTFALIDALRAYSGIPRQNIVAHCEWPLSNGQPVRSSTYRLLRGQSACPGSTLFPHVPAYRSLPDLPPLYRVVEVAPVYEVPMADPKRVALKGAAVLPIGQEVRIGKTYENGMGWLLGGLGFVEMKKLRPA